MKKFLQKASSFKLEDNFVNFKEKGLNFINTHSEIFCLSVLAVSCLIFLFLGLWAYPLLDVDETRYAIMSRDLINSTDWNSLMLNGVPFLEKPPLYFWLTGASIKLFGVFSPFAVRFPIALITSFLIFFTYYVGKKIISKKFGVISALILLSSAFFLILSHIAILDMVLTVFMTSSIYCGLLTHFCKEKNKKYWWFLFYLFIGLGFLAKGILSLAIPVIVLFIYNLWTRTLKDMFKPVNIVPGVLIFLVLITPWHFVMYQKYGYKFIKEYFLLHHFARFINSVNIGRERPLLYFVPVFLLGFMPWAFVFIDFLYKGIKKLVSKYKTTEGNIKEKILALVEANTNEQKLVLFSLICFAVIFAVFSSSSTKLPTYILPAFPFAALLTGYYWFVSDERGENEKLIYNSTLLFSAIFILAATVAFIGYYILPFDLQYKLVDFKDITIISTYLLAVFLVLRLYTKRALSIFSGYVFTMFFVITLASFKIFNFVYSTGENELVAYSNISANNVKASQLVTFDFSVKPSVLINPKNKITFITNPDFEALDELLGNKCKTTFVIVKNKNFKNNQEYVEKISKRLKLGLTGEKYSLYVKALNKKYSSDCFELIK